ncbi:MULTISPECIES: ROK family transcriptional regulator [unclassified Rathayibacter]|uniref:ROK family transcriptional regulator n=1 Tax=unclassified Rathayibacter TaxID=2609250 RepID=UPI000FA28A18|nr:MULTISPECIES: ROK family transcriptional regulator [unclassified Rathayibacter]MCJ1687648.1 ROK family transcriptional regulator [Rathayibacter sp. VKM Ac-2927]ROP48433.1 putative NBD/HSP70 family sugar kinase [Rathayibacter sp. PhB186]ROS49263.1 putative NBD/HSP70 family sugar kinase [Rathayibacter sp. PhB185]
MKVPRTATTRVVTEINRTAIVDALRLHGPSSRSAIARHTGLSPATVERLCSALLGEGVIVLDGRERSSGGRPSSLYRYAGDARVVAAIEVSETQAHGRLVDFDGKTVRDEVLAFDLSGDGSDADRRLAGTIETVDLLMAASKRIRKPCAGVGVTIPGIVHGPEGRVTNTIELGWSDVMLGSILKARVGVPVLVENDANAIGFGEWSRGAGRGAQSLATYVLGVGVGAGIVHDGALLRGSRSAAGEIGYLVTERSHLERPYTTQGDLESRIAGISRSYAREHAADATNPLEALLDAAAAGDEGALAPAGEIFDYIGLSCIALCTVLDPELIVLAGHLSRQPEYAVQEVTRRLVGRITIPPRIVTAELGADAALVGVAQLIIARSRTATYLS